MGRRFYTVTFDPHRPFHCTATQAKSLAGPEVPYLVSFPRCGSHWLRIMLEKLTDRPCLCRSFLPHPEPHWLLIHQHDEFCKTRPAPQRRVLVLYRRPEDVVFSKVEYDGTLWRLGVPRVMESYHRWIEKWVKNWDLHGVTATLKYADLWTRPAVALNIAVQMLTGQATSPIRAMEVAKATTKDLVRELTGHDPKVIGTRRGRKKEFLEVWGATIRGRFKDLEWAFSDADA